MMRHRRAPGVQHGGDADAGAEVFGVGGDRGQRLGRGLEQDVVVPGDVPVDKFWSAIVYSGRTKSFIPNLLNRVGLDSYDKSKLKANADGSAIFTSATSGERLR